MPLPTGPDLLTELAGAWVATLLDASLKGTVALAAAMIAARVFRSRPAAMRHLMWASALAGLLLLPVLTGVLPPVEVPGLPDVSARAGLAPAPDGPAPGAVASAPAGTEGTPGPEAAPAGAGAAGGAGSTRPTGSRVEQVPPPLAIGAIWLLGAILVLARGVAGRIRVWWLARSATPVRGGPWTRTRDRLARRLALRRQVRLLAGSTSSVPMTWGLLRPRILLPPEAAEWSPACRRNVLMHELAHVRRGDYLMRLAGWAAAALYWFHPLVWVALRRMRREQEQACDDHVLRAGVRPSVYAGQLIRLARRLRPRGSGVGVGTSGGGPSEFYLRMRSLLRADRPRGPVRRGRFVAAGAVAALLVSGLAVLAPVPGAGGPEPGDAVVASPAVGLPVATAPVADMEEPDAGAPDAGEPEVEDDAAAPTDAGSRGEGTPARAEPPPRVDPAADESRGSGPRETDGEEAAAVTPATAAAPVADPAPPGEEVFFHGGGPTGQARVALGPPSPFERASRAARPQLDLATNRGAEGARGSPGEGAAAHATICSEGCTVEGMLRRLAERTDPARRLELLRRLAEAPSDRAASVLMDLTYRASHASDRRLAVEALAGVQGTVGDRYLFQVARANPWVSVRAAAIDELARSDGEEVVPWLVSLAYHDVSPEVQKFTVSVLARLDRAGAGSGLLQIARSHPEDRVRSEAVYWLVRTGREGELERLMESA